MKTSFVFLLLAVAAAFASAEILCPRAYCQDNVMNSECYYSQSYASCVCTTVRGCMWGCNDAGTDCATQPTFDPRCPDQCYEGRLHYRGWWSDERQSCLSVETSCPYGCLPDHTACNPNPPATPTPVPTVPTCRNNFCENGYMKSNCNYIAVQARCVCDTQTPCASAQCAADGNSCYTAPTPSSTPVPSPSQPLMGCVQNGAPCSPQFDACCSQWYQCRQDATGGNSCQPVATATPGPTTPPVTPAPTATPVPSVLPCMPGLAILLLLAFAKGIENKEKE